MPDNKSQHYVPKCYLKNFAVDEGRKAIAVVVLGTRKSIVHASIKDQAAVDFFYGKDGALESWLSNLEARAAPVLQDIIRSSNLPRRGSKEYNVLHAFCIVQAGRTSEAIRAMNEVFEAQEASMRRMGGKMDGKPEIKGMNLMALRTIHANVRALEHTRDLQCKLILNHSSVAFLTSDHPVVRYNQIAERLRMPNPGIGFGSRGFQMFLPIGPRHALLYYDLHMYRVGSRKRDTVQTVDQDDATQMNLLQVLNAGKVLYHNADFSEQYLDGLIKAAKSKAGYKSPSIIEQPTGKDRQLFIAIGSSHHIHLKLSFVRETDKGKLFRPSGLLVDLRDESLFGPSNGPKYSVQPPEARR